MDKSSQIADKKKSKSFFRWLLWWQIDQDELGKQLAKYRSLKITQSARGLSFILLIFSASVTTIFIVFFHWDRGNFFGVFVSLLLGYFVYRGHKWAMIGAMIYWSFEKFYLAYEGLQGPSGTQSPSPNSLIHLVWWAIYMHAFYLAFRVERLRKQSTAQISKDMAVTSKVRHLDELEKLADLKNKGIITEEEFNAKKKQILDL